MTIHDKIAGNIFSAQFMKLLYMSDFHRDEQYILEFLCFTTMFKDAFNIGFYSWIIDRYRNDDKNVSQEIQQGSIIFLVITLIDWIVFALFRDHMTLLSSHILYEMIYGIIRDVFPLIVGIMILNKPDISKDVPFYGYTIFMVIYSLLCLIYQINIIWLSTKGKRKPKNKN